MKLLIYPFFSRIYLSCLRDKCALLRHCVILDKGCSLFDFSKGQDRFLSTDVRRKFTGSDG
jgi:hypothetical protein